MKVRSWRNGRGTSLLEVLVAMMLMGMSALAVISAQLGFARAESAVAMRERAALIADSIAEAAHGSVSEAAALKQWNLQAESTLPNADASVREQGDSLALSMVRWAARRPDSRTSACGDVSASVSTDTSCLSITFAR
jgi:Tfp pilus assembly protein PilV